MDTNVQIISIPIDDSYADRRIDAVMSEEIAELTRSHAQKLMEQGLVQCNGKVLTKPSTKLKVGDILEVTIPEPEPLDVLPL